MSDQQNILHHKIKTFVINENQQILQDDIKNDIEKTVYINKNENTVKSFLNTKHNYINVNNVEINFIKNITNNLVNDSTYLSFEISIKSENEELNKIQNFRELYDYNNSTNSYETIVSQVKNANVQYMTDNDIFKYYTVYDTTNPFYLFAERIIYLYNNFSSIISYKKDNFKSSFNTFNTLYGECSIFVSNIKTSNTTYYNFVENFPDDFYSSYKNLNADNIKFKNPLNIIQYNGSCYYLMPLNQNITSIIDNRLHEKSDLWTNDVINQQTLYWKLCNEVFSINKNYIYNDVVKYNDKFYHCILATTDSSTKDPSSNTTNWSEVKAIWNKNTIYNVNDFVLYTEDDKTNCYKSLQTNNKFNIPSETHDATTLVHTFQNRSQNKYRPNYGKALDSMYSKIKYLITDDNSIPLYDTEFSFLCKIFVGDFSKFIQKLDFNISKYNAAGSLGCYIKSSTTVDGFNYQLFLTRLREDNSISQNQKDLYVANIIKNIEDDIDIISYLDKKAVISHIDDKLYGKLNIENYMIEYNRCGVNYSTIPNNLMLNNSLSTSNNNIVYNYYKLKNGRDPHLNFNVSIQPDTDYLYELNQLFDPEKNIIEYQFTDNIIQKVPNEIKSFDKLTGLRTYTNVGNITIEDRPWYSYKYMSIKDDYMLDSLKEFQLISTDQYNMYNLMNKYFETVSSIQNICSKYNNKSGNTASVQDYFNDCSYLKNILTNYDSYKLFETIIKNHFFNSNQTSYFDNIFNNTFSNRSFDISTSFKLIENLANNYNRYIQSFNYLLYNDYINLNDDLYTLMQYFKLLVPSENNSNCLLSQILYQTDYIDAKSTENTTNINIDLVIQRKLVDEWYIKTLQYLLDCEIVYHNDKCNDSGTLDKINNFGKLTAISGVLDFCEKSQIEESIKYTTYDLTGSNFSVEYILNFLKTFIDIYKDFLDDIINSCKLLFKSNANINEFIEFINMLLPIDSAEYIKLQHVVVSSNVNNTSLKTLLSNFNDPSKEYYNNEILIRLSNAKIKYDILNIDNQDCSLQNLVQFAINYNNFNNTIQYFKNNIVKNTSNWFSKVRVTSCSDENAIGDYTVNKTDNNQWSKIVGNVVYKLTYDNNGANNQKWTLTKTEGSSTTDININDNNIDAKKQLFLNSLLIDGYDHFGKETKYLKHILNNSSDCKKLINKQLQLLQKLQNYFKEINIDTNDISVVSKICEAVSQKCGEVVFSKDLMSLIYTKSITGNKDTIINTIDTTNKNTPSVYSEFFDVNNKIPYNKIIDDSLIDNNYPTVFAGYMIKYLLHLMNMDKSVNDVNYTKTYNNGNIVLTSDEENKVNGLLNLLGLDNLEYNTKKSKAIDSSGNLINWSESTVYAINSVIYYDGEFYECIKAIPTKIVNGITLPQRIITPLNTEYWSCISYNSAASIEELLTNSVDFECLTTIIKLLNNGIFNKDIMLFSNFSKVIINTESGEKVYAQPNGNNNYWKFTLNNTTYEIKYEDNQWLLKVNNKYNILISNYFNNTILLNNTISLTRSNSSSNTWTNGSYKAVYNSNKDLWEIYNGNTKIEGTLSNIKLIKDITTESTPSLYSIFKWFNEEYNYDQYNTNNDKKVSNLTKIKEDLQKILDHSYLNTSIVTIENLFDLLFNFRNLLSNNNSSNSKYLYVLSNGADDKYANGNYTLVNNVWTFVSNNKTYTITINNSIISLNRAGSLLTHDVVIDTNDPNFNNSTSIIEGLRTILNRPIDVDYQFVKDLYSDSYSLFSMVDDLSNLYPINSSVGNVIDYIESIYQNQDVVDILYNLILQGLESTTNTNIPPSKYLIGNGVYIDLLSTDFKTISNYWIDLAKTDIFKEDVNYNTLKQLCDGLKTTRSYLSNSLILKTVSVKTLFDQLSNNNTTKFSFISYSNNSTETKNARNNLISNLKSDLNNGSLGIIKNHVGVSNSSDNNDMLYKYGVVTIYDLINFIYINNIFEQILNEIDQIIWFASDTGKDTILFTNFKNRLNSLLTNATISDISALSNNSNLNKFDIFTTSPLIIRNSDYQSTKIDNIKIKFESINEESLLKNITDDNTSIQLMLTYNNDTAYYKKDIVYYEDQEQWYQLKDDIDEIYIRGINPSNGDYWTNISGLSSIYQNLGDNKIKNTKIKNVYYILNNIASIDNLNNYFDFVNSNYEFNETPNTYSTSLTTSTISIQNFANLYLYITNQTINYSTYKGWLESFININKDSNFESILKLDKFITFAASSFSNLSIFSNSIISNNIISTTFKTFINTDIPYSGTLDVDRNYFIYNGNDYNLSSNVLNFNNFNLFESIKLFNLYNKQHENYTNVKNMSIIEKLIKNNNITDIKVSKLKYLDDFIKYNNKGYFKNIVEVNNNGSSNSLITNGGAGLLEGSNIIEVYNNLLSSSSWGYNIINLMKNVFNNTNFSDIDVGYLFQYLKDHRLDILSLYNDPDNPSSNTQARNVAISYVWRDYNSDTDPVNRYTKWDDFLIYNPNSDAVVNTTSIDENPITGNGFYIPKIKGYDAYTNYNVGDVVVHTINVNSSDITRDSNDNQYWNNRLIRYNRIYNSENNIKISIFYKKTNSPGAGHPLPEDQTSNEYWEIECVGFDPPPTNKGVTNNIFWKPVTFTDSTQNLPEYYNYSWKYLIKNNKIGYIVAYSNNTDSGAGRKGTASEPYVVYIYDYRTGNNFNIAESYSKYQLVRYNGRLYMCQANIDACNEYDPNSTSYNIGDVVYKENQRYKCIRSFNIIPPATIPSIDNTTYWQNITTEIINSITGGGSISSTNIPYATPNNDNTSYTQSGNWRLLLKNGSGYRISTNITVNRSDVATFETSQDAATAILKYKNLINNDNDKICCDIINSIGSANDSKEKFNNLFTTLTGLANTSLSSAIKNFATCIYKINNVNIVYELIKNTSNTHKSIESLYNLLTETTTTVNITLKDWVISNASTFFNEVYNSSLTDLIGNNTSNDCIWLNGIYSYYNGNELTFKDLCRIFECIGNKYDNYNYLKNLLILTYSYQCFNNIPTTGENLIKQTLFFNNNQSNVTVDSNIKYDEKLFNVINSNTAFNNFILSTIHSIIKGFKNYIINSDNNFTNAYYLLEYIYEMGINFASYSKLSDFFYDTDHNIISKLIPTPENLTLKEVYNITKLLQFNNLIINNFDGTKKIRYLLTLSNIMDNYRNMRSALQNNSSITLSEYRSELLSQKDQQDENQNMINSELLQNPILLYNKGDDTLNAGLNDTLFNFFQFLSLLNSNLSNVTINEESNENNSNQSCIYQFFKTCSVIQNYNNTYVSYLNLNFTLQNLIDLLNTINDDDVYNFINIIYPTLVLTGSPEQDQTKNWSSTYVNLNGSFKLNTIPVEVTKKLNLLSPSNNISDLIMLYDILKYVNETSQMNIIYTPKNKFIDVYNSLSCVCYNEGTGAPSKFFSFIADYQQKILNIYSNISEENPVYELIKYKLDGLVYSKYFKDVVEIASSSRVSQINHIYKIDGNYGITLNYFKKYIFNSNIYPTLLSYITDLKEVCTSEFGELVKVLNYENDYPFNSVVVSGEEIPNDDIIYSGMFGVYQPISNDYNKWVLSRTYGGYRYENTLTYNVENKKWILSSKRYGNSPGTTSKTFEKVTNKENTWKYSETSINITLTAIAKYRNINDLLVLLDNMEIIHVLNDSGLLKADKVEINQFSFFNENIYLINNIIQSSLLTQNSTIAKLKDSILAIDSFELAYLTDLNDIMSIEIINNLLTNFGNISLIKQMIEDKENNPADIDEHKFIKYLIDIYDKLNNVLITIKPIESNSTGSITISDLMTQYQNSYDYKCIKQVIDDVNDFEMIECSKGVFKYNQTESHKSNIYSIRIKNSNLSLNDVTNEDEKETKIKIRNMFEAVIKEHIKRYMPAHTHLWKIEYED